MKKLIILSTTLFMLLSTHCKLYSQYANRQIVVSVGFGKPYPKCTKAFSICYITIENREDAQSISATAETDNDTLKLTFNVKDLEAIGLGAYSKATKITQPKGGTIAIDLAEKLGFVSKNTSERSFSIPAGTFNINPHTSAKGQGNTTSNRSVSESGKATIKLCCAVPATGEKK